jgi:hypothetical protein
MNRIIDTVTDTFKGLWSNSSVVAPSPPQTEEEKVQIEGYHIASDRAANKTLILVKESNKYWKTQWFNDSTTTYKSPPLPLGEIFVKHN